MGEAGPMNLDLPAAAADGSAAVFHRRIEFHVARKPFNGFSNNNSANGFKLVTLNPNSSNSELNHKASGSGKKGAGSEVVENGLDPELSFQISFRRIGAGLRNLGNTCFLNSVLQCLTYTEPLAAYLQSGKHQISCHTAGFCALCAIQKHVSRALQSTGRILEPKDLVSNLRCISRNFRNARQEDAHEYMVNLLESMHKCCLPSGVPSESPSAYEKSLVHKIFGGRLRSQVKCMQCSYCSNKFDPFLDLSLEINKADSLYKALAHFTAKEHLDGGAKQYQCQQCQQKVRALKQLTIHKAPYVLTVHLKRFGSHVPGQKIDRKVEFGPTLDLKPFVTGSYEGDLKYTLYGVLVHAGWSTHSGHYYCFVRTSTGMWYALDDNQVFQVSEKKVLEQKAYMLFYVRDRRSYATKRPVSVMQKENMVMNALGNAAYSKFNFQLKENVPNGSVEKKSNSGSGPSSLKVAETATAQKETLKKEELSRKEDGNMAVKDFPLKRDQSEPSQVKVSTENVHCQVSGHDKILNDFIKDVRADENPSGKVNNSSSGTVPCSSSGDLCNSISEMAMSAKANEKALAVSDSIKSSKSGSIDKNQAGDVPKENGDTTAEESRGNKIRQATGMSESLLDPLGTVEQPSCEVSNDKKSSVKVKRKVLKTQSTSMRLSSGMIFGMAFQMRKKKQKRRKQMTKNTKSGRLLVENETPSDTGPSTSCKSPLKHDSRGKRKSKEGGLNENHVHFGLQSSDNGDVQWDVEGGGMSSTEKQTQRSVISGSEEKQPETAHFRISEMYRRQNSVTNMLTRGLEETTVAKWDAMDSSLSGMRESGETETVQIGYVGDEWDEEYDRGKRKKVRGSKIDFDGPNLFQEIATKNAKRKKVKMDRSISGSHPFRI